MSELETHFRPFAEATIGNDFIIETPFGPKPLIYTDWAASGRLHRPTELVLLEEYGPYVANTHTESNECGERMTNAYHNSQQTLKKFVGANESDALIAVGSGMTHAVTMFQRILGWKLPSQFRDQVSIEETDRPVVFVSEMEHHSNQTTWEETIADVVVIPSTETEPIDLRKLQASIEKYKDRKTKVAAITAAANLTGVRLPVHDVAKLMHENNGLCFVDYTCAAPYDEINMHPAEPAEKLDAIYFSPHKFLGGPGTPGVLVFDKALYHNNVPDRPGGGTVTWTNPWGGKHYFDEIEVREDGGTPPFLGVIKAAEAMKLKHEMGLPEMALREAQIVEQVYDELSGTAGVDILDARRKNRLAVFAFLINGGDLHYNLVTRLLNDRFGVQARGGCACAGTYGHCLLSITPEDSQLITTEIDSGDLSKKPGFTRLSFHPTMTSSEISLATHALSQVARFGAKWQNDYIYNNHTNEWRHRSMTQAVSSR